MCCIQISATSSAAYGHRDDDTCRSVWNGWDSRVDEFPGTIRYQPNIRAFAGMRPLYCQLYRFESTRRLAGPDGGDAQRVWASEFRAEEPRGQGATFESADPPGCPGHPGMYCGPRPAPIPEALPGGGRCVVHPSLLKVGLGRLVQRSQAATVFEAGGSRSEIEADPYRSLRHGEPVHLFTGARDRER